MNNLTQFAYDTGDRLKTITYPGSTGTTGFTYDNRGRRTTVTDQNSKTTTYAYDDADRVTTVTDAATPGNVTTYGYDTENNLTSIQDAYDTMNRLQTLTQPAAFSGTGNFGFSYDALSRRTQMTRPNGLKSTYAYDNLSRC